MVDTSARLPIETNVESPNASSSARLIAAKPSPPDCDTSATRPGAGTMPAKVAVSRTRGSLLRTPRQFGPTRRIPDLRHTVSNRSCSAAPSGPASANPAERTTSALTPRDAHSPATAGTIAAGTATTASSTSPGTSAMLRYAGSPAITPPAGLTA